MGNVKVGEAGLVNVVDFAHFLDGTNGKDVGEAIIASLRETGFVYLVNHGLPEEKIKDMFGWSKRFFSQPMETKMLAPHPPSGTHHRGYSAPGKEKVVHHIYDPDELAQNRAKAPDVKESYEIGREHDDAMPNILLPDSVLPGFNEACLDFFWTCYEIEKTILRALALGFGLAEDYFVKVHTAPDNQLRLLHYPSVPVQQLQNDEIIRIGAHSDFGILTLLMQDDVGGLEVEDPKNPGHFQSVPPVEGAIIVNAGDFLMRWSNDYIRSTIHRVRAPPNLTTSDGMTPERYSMPYVRSSGSI
ncbi:hypothetical protein NLI96_g10050 [Meripilus lineatus]|uniref:Fe2OG dioxygenase domain-containing protein n=1 Tax=Meripilus lineatus TaxID=2056292 RepID=A0AAD5UZJ8_9APHY|nr:hypothetical protein NLI96_g10050 [Physisporinus lineatus]